MANDLHAHDFVTDPGFVPHSFFNNKIFFRLHGILLTSSGDHPDYLNGQSDTMFSQYKFDLSRVTINSHVNTDKSSWYIINNH